MSGNDFSILRSLSMGNTVERSLDRYKACVFQANIGGRSPVEGSLSGDERRLLDWRRDLFGSPGPHQDLPEIPGAAPLLRGDRLFLMGICRSRAGQWREAKDLMAKSAQIYAAADEPHRLFRTLVNAQICESDLSNYQSGSLKQLVRESRDLAFWDVVGNAHKALALEHLRLGNWALAVAEAQIALEAYEKLACAEDASLARALLAISLFVNQQKLEAHLERGRIEVVDGKVASYLVIYKALLAGQQPKLVSQHFLARVRWPLKLIKNSSVGSRLVDLLRHQSLDRDELCRQLWGENALGPVYYSRLFTTINGVRKMGQPVHFDGAKYHLLIEKI